MADENPPQNETPPVSADEAPPRPAPAGKFKMFLLLCAAVIVVAAGAGLGAAMLAGRGGPQQAQAAPPAPEAPSTPAPPPAGEPQPEAENGTQNEYVYFDFEPVVVNLDEPRLARYVRVTITLAVQPANAQAVKLLLDKRKPELKNWLTVFFASCTLEEVRGAPNLNRLRREILDNFSQQLWPDQKSLINHVLFKEFAVS
jgi:flagellar basal body-associated protein FliL